MEPPVHKTVFIAPKKKKRVVAGHGKQKTGGCHSASNASIIRRIQSYDVVTRVPDDDVSITAAESPSSSSDVPPPQPSMKDIDVASIKLTCDDENIVLRPANDEGSMVKTLAMADVVEQLNQTSSSSDNYLTLTGTIRRGKRDGQSIDITLNMSREELEKMEAELSRSAEPIKSGRNLFGVGSGIHVFAFSLLVMPFVMIASTCYAFYWGTFTWYNVYLHFSDERGLWHRVIVCPLLVLTYPFQIPPVSLGVGAYAALAQVSWRYDRWHAEVQDLEKGFFGWACASLHLVDCAPYQVVVLNDVPVDAEKINIKSKHVDTTTV